MDDTEVIEGHKFIVLKDCEDVIVEGGARILVRGAAQVAVIGSTDVQPPMNCVIATPASSASA